MEVRFLLWFCANYTLYVNQFLYYYSFSITIAIPFVKPFQKASRTMRTFPLAEIYFPRIFPVAEGTQQYQWIRKPNIAICNDCCQL